MHEFSANKYSKSRISSNFLYSKLPPPPRTCHFFTPKTPSGVLWGGGEFFFLFSYQNISIFLSSTAFVTKSILCCQPGTGIYPKNMKVFILNAIYVFHGVKRSPFITQANPTFIICNVHVFYTVLHLVWHLFIFHTTAFSVVKNSEINLVKCFYV